jgi:hypothetical protein
MADEETPKRKRSMKPKPAVIDLEATEIEREAPPAPEPEPVDVEPQAAAAEPSAEEARPVEPETFEEEPRSPLGALIAAGIAGAAVALSAFVLLLALGLIPIGSGSDPALGNRIAQLETQLAAKPAAAPSASAPVSDDSGLRSDIAALRQDLEALKNTPPPAPDTALQTRVAELAARIDTLAQAPSSGAAVDELRGRIDAVAEQANAARAPDPAAQDALKLSKGASVLAAFAVVESAVSRGVAYTDALASLRRQVPELDLAGLEAGAATGLQSAAVLAREYERDLEAAPPPDTQGSGFADRLAEGARSLVRIRPVAGSPDADTIDPSDPWSARNVIVTRLRTGNYVAAVADRSKLDPVAQKATEDAAGKLAARLEAETALDRLRTDVTARAEARN